jgi:hypothetical protein
MGNFAKWAFYLQFMDYTLFSKSFAIPSFRVFSGILCPLRHFWLHFGYSAAKVNVVALQYLHHGS